MRELARSRASRRGRMMPRRWPWGPCPNRWFQAVSDRNAAIPGLPPPPALARKTGLAPATLAQAPPRLSWGRPRGRCCRGVRQLPPLLPPTYPGWALLAPSPVKPICVACEPLSPAPPRPLPAYPGWSAGGVCATRPGPTSSPCVGQTPCRHSRQPAECPGGALSSDLALLAGRPWPRWLLAFRLRSGGGCTTVCAADRPARRSNSVRSCPGGAQGEKENACLARLLSVDLPFDGC